MILIPLLFLVLGAYAADQMEVEMPRYDIRFGSGNHSKVCECVQLNDLAAVRFARELLEQSGEAEVEVWRGMTCILTAIAAPAVEPTHDNKRRA